MLLRWLCACAEYVGPRCPGRSIQKRRVHFAKKQFCHCSFGKAALVFTSIIFVKRSSTVFISLESFAKMVMIAKAFNGLCKMLKKKILRRCRKGSTQTFEPRNPISEAEIEEEVNAVEEVSNKLTSRVKSVNLCFILFAATGRSHYS